MTRTAAQPTAERVTALDLVCPVCREPVQHGPQAYRCDRCARVYPIVAGIPDFRLRPDPWIGIEEDRIKALRVAREVQELAFGDAVRRYWELTPSTPRERAERFTAHATLAHERSREWLESVPPTESTAPWLDLGCGTGDLTAAGRDAGVPVVGVDIALRWLVVARRRAGLEHAPFVCCGADALPFANGTFAAALSLGLLEHCPDPLPVLREARRVLHDGAWLRLRTVNRYTCLREPHVAVWGVGLVPRSLADAYVRWRSGQRYLHHRPLSPRELRAAMRASGFADVRVGAARPLRTETDAMGPGGQTLVRGYGAARRIPGARRALAWGAPLLEAEGRA